MVDSFLTVALIALATYRVAWMLAGERGPFDLFERWRDFVGSRYPLRKDGQQSWQELGFNCTWCIGFYAALALYGLWQLDFTRWLVYWLAIAGLQVILNKKFG